MGAGGYSPTRCLCFDLRTGTLIIGVLSLIVACKDVFDMVLFIMGLLIRVVANQLDADQQLTCGSECASVVVLLVLFFLEFVFHLIASSLLIHGVRKNRPGLMYPYIFWGIVSSIMYVIYAVVTEAAFDVAFRSVAVHYFISAIKICFITVVMSYQQQVDRSRQLGLANNGYQQQPDGRTGLTYVRLIES